MKKTILIVLLLTSLLSINSFANDSHLSHKIYISTDGDDSNPGTKGMPLATLKKAQQKVREHFKNKLISPVEVVICQGTYYIDETLKFDPNDSGLPTLPVTWRAEDGHKVLIRGAKEVKNWVEYKNGIYKADLKQQGLEGLYFHQLFYQGKDQKYFSKRQILARYPDFDPEKPRTGGFLYAADTAKDSGFEKLVYKQGSIPFEKWDDISQAEIFTVYSLGWNPATTPITSVDFDSQIINFKKIRTYVIEMNRFFLQNILGALDKPGEWYLDYDSSVLYFYPPDNDIENSKVLVPVIDHIIELNGSVPYPQRPLIYMGKMNEEKPFEEHKIPADAKMNPVEYITFSGIDFECARQDAIRMTGVKNCNVIGCRITNVGNVAVNIGGLDSSFPEVGNPRLEPAKGYPIGAGGSGQFLLAKDPGFNCSVIGCDIWETGSEGIILYGKKNLAENNHIYDNSIWAKDAPAINLLGESNTARRNTLHDMPRCAVFFKGIDNLIELNDIHNVILETSDMGAIRSVHRNIHLGGDIIRYNKISNVPGYGFKIVEKKCYQSPYYSFGVYLDDYTSNVTIFGNIIEGVHRAGVLIHGGGKNLVENNIIVNTNMYQIELGPIRPKKDLPEDGFKGNYIKRNILISTEENTVPYRYTIPDLNDENRAFFAENIIYTGLNQPAVVLYGNSAVKWDQWMGMGEDNGSILADPMFEDLQNGDYRLKPDSPALKMGFKPIPVDKIGCYKSPTRASWPIEPNYDRYREQPVIYCSGDNKPEKTEPAELVFIDPNEEFQMPESWIIDNQ